MKLFGRTVKLTVGTLEVSQLSITFKTKRNLKPEPNTASITVRNLSARSRKILEAASTVFGGTKPRLPARLDAGYGTDLGMLFLGEVRSAVTTVEGPDLISTFETGDSEEEIRKARLNVSYGPRTEPEVALRAMAEALGVGEGNVSAAAALLKSKGKAFFGTGVILSGVVHRHLTDFCNSADLEWSVQDGKLQILDRGKPLEGLAVEIGPSTGMIGSPTVDADGHVHARCLLIPDLRPGRKVVFKSKSFSGGYRVIETEHTGDTHGDDWYVDIVCKKY